MKRFFLLATSFLLLMQISATDWLLGSREKFSLHLVTDSVLTASALGLNLVPILMPANGAPETGTIFSTTSVPEIDRWAMRPYSSALDLGGDILQYAAFLSPLVLLAAPHEEWVTIGVMYAETALLAWGFKELGKSLVSRPRPYMYFESAPTEALADGDWDDAFPSGHTTLAFAGASFASYVFSVYYPNSVWRIPVIAGAYTLAAATAVMRVSSGNHFPSDVLVGAVLGTACGILVPMLHRVQRTHPTKLSLAAGPSSILLTYQL